MDARLLKPYELDTILRYPSGRSMRLAKAGKIPHIQLPDGEIRFALANIRQWLECNSRCDCLGGAVSTDKPGDVPRADTP